MSLHELNARFRRLHKEQVSWRLLRADHAPLILAFVGNLFEETNEVAFSRAKVALDTELSLWREQELLDSDVSAASYLRLWIQAGWLRELDDQLSKTDACEVALRFCWQLEQRESNATASHLRIVQDAVRDLSVAISPDAKERIRLLEVRQAELQRELDDLHAGIVHELSATEQRERIIEVYQLASVLTGDFRRFEDDIRQIDQQLRVQMIESDGKRGEVILNLLQQEQLLADSDAGRAFQGFFALLCDQNRNTELREQLRTILGRPAAQYLSDKQFRFLGRLMRELGKESERVFQVRRRTEENLRQFIESGAASEMRAVDRLLGQLERLAVAFKDREIPLRHAFKMQINSGHISIQSPDSLRLKMPEERLDARNIQAQQNTGTPSDAMLQQLHSVQIMRVAERIHQTLRNSRIPLSIAALTKQQPVLAGLEELVAFLRVAKAIGATELQGRETVWIKDRNGSPLKAEIPHYLLSAEQFPEPLEDLIL